MAKSPTGVIPEELMRPGQLGRPPVPAGQQVVLHVHPSHQGRGLGRLLLQSLLDNSTSRTVVLSTHDRQSPARELYRSFGFVDLLCDFRFPGSSEVYAILGLER